MLQLSTRELRDGPVATRGTMQPDDPAFAGLDLLFDGPVDVTGTLDRVEHEGYLWRGHLRARFRGDCRRCLAAVSLDLDDDVEALFSADPDLADDPAVYPLDPTAGAIDLGEAVREELVLRLTAFPLCRPDCRGLCAKCGAELNAGPCACERAGSTN